MNSSNFWREKTLILHLWKKGANLLKKRSSIVKTEVPCFKISNLLCDFLLWNYNSLNYSTIFHRYWFSYAFRCISSKALNRITRHLVQNNEGVNQFWHSAWSFYFGTVELCLYKFHLVESNFSQYSIKRILLVKSTYLIYVQTKITLIV